MAQHIFTGTAAPATTPTAVGQHFIDTVAKKTYISAGTSSSADWKLATDTDTGITQLTGDVTAGPGSGSQAATIAAGAVTNAKVASGIDAAKIGSGAVSNTEFGYLDGVTSAIQTQLSSKLSVATEVEDGSGNVIFDGVSRIINSSTGVVMADFSDASKVVLFPVVLSGAAPAFNADGSFVINSIHSDTAGQNWYANGLYADNFGDSSGNTIFSVSTDHISFYSGAMEFDYTGTLNTNGQIIAGANTLNPDGSGNLGSGFSWTTSGDVTANSFSGSGSSLTGYAPSLAVGSADYASNSNYANDTGNVSLPSITTGTIYPYGSGPAHMDMSYGAVRNNNNSNLLYDWGLQQMWQLDGLHLSADFDQRKLTDSSDTLNLCWEGGVGLFGASPTGRYSAAQDTTGFTAATGTPWLSGSYITGAVGSSAYSIGDIVTALKLLGVLDL